MAVLTLVVKGAMPTVPPSMREKIKKKKADLLKLYRASLVSDLDASSTQFDDYDLDNDCLQQQQEQEVQQLVGVGDVATKT